ncbi:MAG: hypothetical protein ACHQRM_08645 [Bacteroidia bacterium]
MLRKLRSFIFRSPGDWKYWLMMAFLCRGLLFIFQLVFLRYTTIHGFWGASGGDTDSYLTPIEHLIQKGSYAPNLRMPGYGFFYYPLILLFPKAIACNILIVFQAAMGAVSVYALALLALKTFKSSGFFYLVFFLFGLSTFSAIYDIRLQSESLCTSFLILSIYFYVNYLSGQTSRRNLILSGLFMTLTVFLRPVFVLYFPAMLLMLLVVLYRSNKKLIMPGLCFLAVFIAVDGAWLVRNYGKYHRIVPLTASLNYPNYTSSWVYATGQFVQTWGGGMCYWDPKEEIAWFGTAGKSNVSLPSDIYTSKFNKDSLEQIRKTISTLLPKTDFLKLSTDTCLEETAALPEVVVLKRKLGIYAQSVKEEKPWLYYVKAPALFLKKMIYRDGGTGNLFQKPFTELNKKEKSIRMLYTVLYLFVMTGGLAGMFLLFRKGWSSPLIMISAAVCLYQVVIHAIVFRSTEQRYLVPAYPFFVICSVYLLLTLYQTFFRHSRKLEIT